jgi:uncharacterized protein with ParB-like and HNH nuclease domain
MESTIKKLFDQQNRIFEIPSYQRSYSWNKHNIEQFISDIKDCKDDFYLGHFLFEGLKNSDSLLYVIDGQQRLTTCIIFLSVLKYELTKRQLSGAAITKDLSDIEHYYLRDTRKQTQKFKTVTSDNNFFLYEIIDFKENHPQEANTVSKRNIRKAKELFLSEIIRQKTDVLLKWVNLIENAVITEHTVFNKIKAAQIFAFQNDRGKRLTNLEILKSNLMLFILLSDQNQNKISQDIECIENDFALIYSEIVRIKLDEDEVLNYYWRAISGKGFYSIDVIAGVKDIVKTQKNISEWIKTFVSGLSQAFQTIEKLESGSDFYIKNLNYLNNLSLSYPFLIKAYYLNSDNKRISSLARLLENLTFRYLIRGGRAEIESRLNQHLIDFNNSQNIDELVLHVKSNINSNGWWYYWSDEVLEELLNSGYFYQNRVDNYLLWRFELHISDKNHSIPHNITYNDLITNESIEHIAPQTPTDDMPLANGYGIYEDDGNPENGIKSGEWLNCLGNLMLISQSHNSSIGNKPFKDKLESYGKDNLLNQQKKIKDFVQNIETPIWDKNCIEKRLLVIVNSAKEIWNIDKI